MQRTIIAFCGAAGAGKDEAARALIGHLGFQKRSFAEAIRREVRLAFIDSTYLDEIWPTMPECVQEAFRWCEDTGFTDPWAKPTSDPMRRLLQVWGTEFRREQDEDYWVRLDAESLPDAGHFVYTDVRFPNEAKYILSRGGVIIGIKRDGVQGNGHVSESYWPKFQHVTAVHNNGTIEDFHQSVLRATSPYLNEAHDPA